MRHLSCLCLLIALVALAGCGGRNRQPSATPTPRPLSKLVTVPRVPKKNLIRAYQSLHRAGFRVAVARTFGVFGFGGGELSPYTIRTRPAAGTVLRRGQAVKIVTFIALPKASSVVTDQVQTSSGGAATVFQSENNTSFAFGIRHGRLPAIVKLPSFVHAPLSTLDRWLKKRGYTWIASELPALQASDRPQLLDNYVVVKQIPAAGGLLSDLFSPVVEVTLAARPSA